MTEINPNDRVGWDFLFDHKLIRNYSMQSEFQKAIGKKSLYEVKGWDLVGLQLDDLKRLSTECKNFFC
jgi:hypothetical protein